MNTRGPRNGRVVALMGSLEMRAGLAEVELARHRITRDTLGLPQRRTTLRRRPSAIGTAGGTPTTTVQAWKALSRTAAIRRPGKSAVRRRGCQRTAELQADCGPKVTTAELEAGRGHGLAFRLSEVPERNPGAIREVGLGRDAKMEQRAAMFRALGDQGRRVVNLDAGQRLQDAHCCCSGVAIVWKAGTLRKPI